MSVGLWIKNHFPTRRRIIQVYAALLTNASLKGYSTGLIYDGPTKVLCSPGLNCYSCPGAVAACPLGSLQNSLGSAKTTTPYYIIGILALYGLLLARTICGFLCPFGFFQDMLYKIKTPKVKKSVGTRVLSYLKYLFLIVLVIAVPLIYHSVPGFCKYICPAGLIGGAGGLLPNSRNADYFGMLGFLFSWKFALLIVCVAVCVFIYRAFCRFICPLGAIYGFFNKISLMGVKLDKSQCIECGACIAKCKMDIKHVGDHECINCGECIPVCPTKAISWKGSKIFLKPASVTVSAANAGGEELKPLNVYIENGTVSNANASVSDKSEAVAPEEYAAPTEQAVERAAEEESVKEAQEVLGVEVEHPEEQPAQKQGKKPNALALKFKNRNFVLEFVAWVLATALLVCALVYYNTRPTVDMQNIGNFTCETYKTAYAEEKFTLSDNNSKPTVIIFWNSRNAIGIDYVNDFVVNMYPEVKDSANFVIAHISNADTKETVQGIIDEKGWNTSEIPFIQDTAELNLYNGCCGDNSPTMTAFLSFHSELYAHHSGPMELEKIKEEIGKAFENTSVYQVGDKIPEQMTIPTYHSAYTADSYNIAEAKGKVLVFNFWYTTCGGCVAELPFFNSVLSEYTANGKPVVMLALHSDNHEKPQPFIEEKGWSDWGVIFGQDYGDVIYKTLGGKGAYPVTVIVNINGEISFVRQGSMAEEVLRTELDKALQPDTAPQE